MSGSRIEEEGKQQLIQDGMQFGREEDANADAFGEYNDFDIKPNSSRVKKVLIWNKKRCEFEMSDQDKKDLQEFHITDQDQW